jgi:hypothetical protein
MSDRNIDATRPDPERAGNGLETVKVIDSRQAEVLGRSVANMLHALQGTKLADSRRTLSSSLPTSLVGTSSFAELYVEGERGAFVRFGVDASKAVSDQVMRVSVGSDLADTPTSVQEDTAYAIASRLAAAHRELGSNGLTLRVEGAQTLSGLPAAMRNFGFAGEDGSLESSGVADLLMQREGEPVELTRALRTLNLAGGAQNVKRHGMPSPAERVVDLTEALRQLPRHS